MCAEGFPRMPDTWSNLFTVREFVECSRTAGALALSSWSSNDKLAFRTDEQGRDHRAALPQLLIRYV